MKLHRAIILGAVIFATGAFCVSAQEKDLYSQVDQNVFQAPQVIATDGTNQTQPGAPEAPQELSVDRVKAASQAALPTPSANATSSAPVSRLNNDTALPVLESAKGAAVTIATQSNTSVSDKAAAAALPVTAVDQEKQPQSSIEPAPSQVITPASPADNTEKTKDALIRDAAKPAKDEKPVVLLPIEERLQQPISLDLRNIDIFEALKYVASKGDLNIVATKNVAGRVSLTLQNVPLKDVIDLMLRSNSLAVVQKGEVFNIMTDAEYKALYGKNFSDQRQVKIMRLKYAVPEQAFSLLDALKSDIGRVLVDPEAGNVLIMDTPEKIEQLTGALDEFEKQNLVEVFNLNYAKAKEVEEILKVRIEGKKVGTVKADERNNQIIVQTLPGRMQEIARLIRSIDRPTKEVLIDVKIVKIALNDNQTRGMEWEGILRTLTGSSETGYIGSYPFSNMTSSSNATFSTRSDTYSALGDQIGSYPFSGTTSSLNSSTAKVLGDNTHFGIISGKRDFDAVINYIDTKGHSKILSNPKLIVVNDQEAKIHIGERQAYVTSTTSTGQTTSTVSEEVTFVDVGVQFSVTVHINDEDFITMKVKPEISTVSSTLTTPTNNSIPIIDTSLVETTAMMKDGTTLLIAGLRKEEKNDTGSETPWFGKIPFIGNAFKSISNKTTRTELLVMITPRIISGKDFNADTAERFIGDKPPKNYKEYQPLVPDKAMLPESFGTEAAPVGVKPYRDYLSFNEKKEGALSIKGLQDDDESK
ncbi:MAG TPA: secretin N-terminal domain-containing protein [Candidatus Omnitrophota bacterium]|nr:secretin N-terminal domain-containing protein [Candidatus Omnitrophota bacterium]HPT07801.1 secretin N-terminal domain-containing protein [Candidatus Omnitrophota bacterium]